MSWLKFLILILILENSAFRPTEGAKILCVFPLPGPSQYICVEAYLKKLAARGHEITSVSMFPQKTSVINFRDITLKNEHTDHDEFINEAIEEMERSKLNALRTLRDYAFIGSLTALKNEEFQHLLRSNVHFDLIIIEAFYMDALYALGHHFKAPMIGVGTFGGDVINDQLVDNFSPVAIVPAPSSKNIDHMNFWQRLDNLYAYTVELLYHHLFIIPEQQRLYEKYFPNATLDLSSEVRRDFSLLLLNQHFSLNYPRPLVPNVIEVAGMHIKEEPNKLPTDLEAFINAAPKGAIYFSLGSNVKSAYLSKEKLAAFMNAFAKLPVNVLWKFEKDDLPGKPDNVYISKWFPQSDILAHHNVKLFITHGGMHSLIETVHYGKPIVGIPVFYDQHLNIARAQAKGLGVVLNFKEFTSEELYSAVYEVLNNPIYFNKAQETSAIFLDRPKKPLDTAIYWTEYLLWYRGAPQMRVAARHLNFLQINSLDTMAVLFGIPLLLVVLITIGVCKLFRTSCASKKNNTRKNGKQKKN